MEINDISFRNCVVININNNYLGHTFLEFITDKKIIGETSLVIAALLDLLPNKAKRVIALFHRPIVFR